MEIIIDPIAVRILGALIEKEATTPDYYPLSLNALVNACNQKSNRDPVMQVSEREIEKAIDALCGKRLMWKRSVAGARVMKYEQNLKILFNFSGQEIAVLCVLMLRGPQTIGEIRLRTERMCAFATIDEVEIVVRSLMDREDGPFILELPRQPGRKEPRFVHLFSGKEWAEQFTTAADAPVEAAFAGSGNSQSDRVSDLEAAVSDLQGQMRQLQQQFEDFKKLLE
jgi:uncharacterized protein YceH (UPF0502 family)